MSKFQEVTAEVEQALSAIAFEKLDISDEVKEQVIHHPPFDLYLMQSLLLLEKVISTCMFILQTIIFSQVELVLAQFRRAKGRVDSSDAELYDDLLSLYSKNIDAEKDPDVLRRLVEKLQLGGIADLTQESLALHEMVGATGGDPEESIEKMSMLLKKVKDFVQTVNPNIDSTASGNSAPTSSSGKAVSEGNTKNLVIPDDFRCPISLELMKDPVIVSTGQVLSFIILSP